MQKQQTQKKTKIPFYSSIKMKIMVLVVISIVATSSVISLQSISVIKQNMMNITKNYMTDIANISGKNIDNNLTYAEASQVLSAEQLGAQVGEVSVEGMDSSYAYVVSNDGTMLYHPTAEKIGQPVENDAVKQLLADIEKGNRLDPDVISYEFNSVDKYAAYYIGQDMNFIVIVTADESEVFEAVNGFFFTIVMCGIVVLVACATFGFIMARRIVRPIEKVTEEIDKLASMDFTKPETTEKVLKQKDETGVMTRAVVELQQKLVEVVKSMQEQSQQLHETSENVNGRVLETKQTMEQVDKAIGEVADGAASQADETQTASENIIFMGNMIEDTKEEVKTLRANADEMRISGNEALDILEELSAINQKTKEAIQLISEQTDQTNQSALEIKSAIDIITNIAEETSLLSLNASIEAARAGEQGKGFAVVASQIQNLAEQSNASASQIEEIVKLLISDSEKTVATMVEVNQVVDKQDTDVRKTADAFDRVKSGIDSSIKGIDNIATRTDQLDEARVKVVDIVQNLTAIAEENAASTEETSASAAEVGEIMTKIADDTDNLNHIANRMEESVSQFIVN